MELKEIVTRIGIILESEKTTFEPSLSVLLSIIESCGSSPAEFFSDDITQYQLDKQTLDFLKTLSPYQKEAIMNLYKK